MKLLQNVFINRDFGLLFMGRFVSQLGDGIHYFAMAWLVLDLTGSGAALGTLLMAASVPAILLAPFSGVLADTWDRKKIVVSMDIIRGVLMLGLAAVYGAGQLTLPLLYAATILLSLCGVLFGPAISATIPGLVKREELVKANGRDAFSHSATGILGPILGALLLGGFGYMGIFLIKGGTYLVSAVSEMCIRFPERPAPTVSDDPKGDFINNLKGGFGYLWNNQGLRVLIGGGLILNFLFNPLFGVVFPFFGKEVLLMPPQYYGFTQSSFPVGMLLGTILAAAIASRWTKIKILAGGAALQGAAVMAIGLLALPMVYTQLSSEGILLAMLAPMLIMGLINVQVNVQVNVMMQETVPDSYRGRVFALFGSMMQMAAPIGMGLFGVLLDIIPVHFFFLFCGSMVAVVATALGTSPALRTLCAGRGATAPEASPPAIAAEAAETTA